jgi:hypothetical protein
MNRLGAALALLLSLATPALADVLITPGTTTTIFDFTCFATKHCPIAVLTDTAGASLATAPGTPNAAFALPVQGVTGGTPQPVSQSGAPWSVNATLQAAATTAIGKVDPNTPANWALGATGAAVPANASYLGINVGGNLTGWNGAVSNAGTFAVQLTGATNNVNNVTGTVSLPTGAATAANQTTALGIIGNSNSGTVAHGCLIAGYSVLGCLGQIDDDVKATGNVIGAPNITLTDCSGSIATGGSQQSAITTQTTLHGFTLANIDNSAGSGELIWFSFTGTAAAATAGSYPLAPVSGTITGPYTWTSPVGMGTNHAVSIIAATTGHKFSCTWW